MTDLTKSANYFRRYVTTTLLEHKDKKCIISGTKDNLTVHHLNIGFRELLEEAYEAAGLKYNHVLTGLSIEDRETIKSHLIKLHEEKAQYVTLSISLHKKYHELNQRNISPEQFEVFKRWCKKNKKRNHNAVATRRKNK